MHLKKTISYHISDDISSSLQMEILNLLIPIYMVHFVGCQLQKETLHSKANQLFLAKSKKGLTATIKYFAPSGNSIFVHNSIAADSDVIMCTPL